MKVSDLLVKSLEAEDVRYVFGVPGEENEDLLFSLEQSSIQFVPTRHEQGAAFIANVWGRLTGEAGVCLSTLGPGATNLITGVADANLDKAPVVAITAQGGLARMHHESHQVLNVVNMFRPITKWNTAVQAPNTITEVVRKAFKLAEMEKPGATHIELAEDVAAMEVHGDREPIAPHTVRRPGPDQKSIEATFELLKLAKRPLIIAGNGAIRKRSSRYLRRLVEALNIPVVHTFMGKGAVSDRASQSLLAMGLGFKDYVFEAVFAADLILTVGYDIAEYAPEKWNLNTGIPVVHIDFTPAEVYTHYRPAVEVVGDISSVLHTLNERLADAVSPFDASWYAPVRARILREIASYTLSDEEERFTVPGVLNLLREIMRDDGLLISDVGAHKLWIARNYLTCCANGCIISNGLASMGIALPGGIAASLIDPQREVVAAMGDGGFLMNAQELETAKRLGVGFTILIFNDNDYGLISWKQRLARDRSVFTRITNPDFKAYAESFGILSYRPRTVRELKQQLSDAVTSRQLCVIEVPVDASVNDKLSDKLEAFGSSTIELR